MHGPFQLVGKPHQDSSLKCCRLICIAPVVDTAAGAQELSQHNLGQFRGLELTFNFVHTVTWTYQLYEAIKVLIPYRFGHGGPMGVLQRVELAADGEICNRMALVTSPTVITRPSTTTSSQ